MKNKISITINPELIKIIDRMLDDGLFRNRSHIIEYSLKEFVEEKKNEK